jgi:outer membrane protein assembly factor BamE (lipoprotein component of BamABCDE complex)
MALKRSGSCAAALGVAALIGLAHTGCLTVGREFPTHSVTQIEIGETTRDQVQRLFGSPWRTGIEDGQRTWTYGHYRYALLGPARTRDLVVRFDAEGVVSSFTFNTTMPGDLDSSGATR